MGDFGAVGAWLLLVIVVIGAVLIAMGVWLASHVVSRNTRPEHNSILSPFLTVVGPSPVRPIGVTPQPFAHAVKVFDSVDSAG
jgi:hypothetical protein